MDQEIKKALAYSDKLYHERYINAVENFKNERKHLEKRISDIYKWPAILLSILTFLLLALGVSSYLNIRDEIRRIDNFRSTIIDEIEQNKKELREEISDLFLKSVKDAEVILLKGIDVPLGGQKVNGVLVYEEKYKGKDKWRIIFNITLTNIGKGTASEFFAKIYIFDAKRIDRQSTIPEFGQEITKPPEQFPTKILPPNASIPLRVPITSTFFDPKIKNYPALIQIWFGKELPSEARFEIVVEKVFTKDMVNDEEL